MPNVEYNLRAFDSADNDLGFVEGVKSFSCTLATNAISVLTCETNDTRLLHPDVRIEVWRVVENGPRHLLGDTAFFVRNFRRVWNGRAWTYNISAYSLAQLLERRIIATYAGSPEARRQGAADDIAKAYVRAAIMPTAQTTAEGILRSIPNFTVATDVSLGPTVTKSAAYKNLFSTVAEIAATSAEMGTNLYFDVVRTDTNAFQFQTFIGQRGADRRQSSTNPTMEISPENGVLADVQITSDFRAKKVAAYVGGQGKGPARELVFSYSVNRYVSTPYAYDEMFVDSRNPGGNLAHEARRALREHRARKTFTATILQSSGFVFGQDWNWGDYISAYADTQKYDCRIEGVAVQYTNAIETITGKLAT